MLRVQRYVNDIRKIIEKTEIYGREMGIIGKYLRVNIRANISNYLDMIRDRKGFTKEELAIIIKEFGKYLDDDLLYQYSDDMESILDMSNIKLSENYNDYQSPES